MRRVLVLAGLPLLLLSGCATTPPPLFEDLGSYHRAVSTKSEMARRYFNQGLVLTYAFNHDEAVRAFQEAARQDPSFALAFWGEALALGPNINLALSDVERARRAHRACQRALALSTASSPVERALIQALAHRYDDPPPEDRVLLDRAYADAMRQVWQAFPEDPDVGTLFAEALLDLSPWNQWTRDGRPHPGTEEVLVTLEAVLARHPGHPGANHFYIHTVEASPEPEKGLDAAVRLSSLVPAAGHLVHMPAHIYIRTGRYGEAVEANARGVAADRAYLAQVGPQGVYEFYRAHNHHFRAYAAMFDGRRELALEAARDLRFELPPRAFEEMPGLIDGFLPTELHVMIRFGMWEEILREAEPEGPFPIFKAMWHYARGVALANLGSLGAARTEASLFEEAVAAVPEDAVIGTNKARAVLGVAREMLAGEMLYREGKAEEAFAALRRGIEAEESLTYDEPAGWMQPVRHALGALLLGSGRVAEAEQVYRADLERHPENGWSLYGLAECLRRRGEPAAAEAAALRFGKAWVRSDVEIAASCYCGATW